MAINWKLRFLNRQWWMAIVPAVVLCLQAFADLFGVELDFGEQTDKVMVAVDTLFAVLAIAGVSLDPTTQGWSDSERALRYEKPYERDINGDGKVDERDIDELLRMLQELKEEK